MYRFPKAAFPFALLLSMLLPCAAEPKYRAEIMPKLVGIAYYDAVKRGVEEAAKELPWMEPIRSGPAQDEVEKQIETIEKLIPPRPVPIAVAANNPVAIRPVLKKAHDAGIRAMSWDGNTPMRCTATRSARFRWHSWCSTRRPAANPFSVIQFPVELAEERAMPLAAFSSHSLHSRPVDAVHPGLNYGTGKDEVSVALSLNVIESTGI